MLNDFGIVPQFQSPPIDGFAKGSTIGAGDQPVHNLGNAFDGFFLAGERGHSDVCWIAVVVVFSGCGYNFNVCFWTNESNRIDGRSIDSCDEDLILKMIRLIC